MTNPHPDRNCAGLDSGPVTDATLEAELVSMDEIADLLGVSRRQPYDWLTGGSDKRQRLVSPDAKKGGVHLWRRSTIEDWLGELGEWATVCATVGHDYGRNGRCCFCQRSRTEIES